MPRLRKAFCASGFARPHDDGIEQFGSWRPKAAKPSVSRYGSQLSQTKLLLFKNSEFYQLRGRLSLRPSTACSAVPVSP